MARQPKRLPGDRDPQPTWDEIAAAQAVHARRNGHGSGDLGIGRGISAFLAWRKRRTAVKNLGRG